MATGLIQDLTTGLKERIAPHLDTCLNMLIHVLGENLYSTEVKTIAIVAIGDLCLVTETAFQPHFGRSM